MGMLRHCAIGTSVRSSTARRLEPTSREACYAQGLRKTREREANKEPTKTLSLSLEPFSFSLSLLSLLSLSEFDQPIDSLEKAAVFEIRVLDESRTEPFLNLSVPN